MLALVMLYIQIYEGGPAEDIRRRYKHIDTTSYDHAPAQMAHTGLQQNCKRHQRDQFRHVFFFTGVTFRVDFERGTRDPSKKEDTFHSLFFFWVLNPTLLPARLARATLPHRSLPF